MRMAWVMVYLFSLSGGDQQTRFAGTNGEGVSRRDSEDRWEEFGGCQFHIVRGIAFKMSRGSESLVQVDSDIIPIALDL